jgi:hypothetical protein
LIDTALTANTATYKGGAIWQYGTVQLYVEGSEISGNSAGQAGAIYSQGPLTIKRSSIVANSATDFTGGIFAEFTLTISNSTLSDNSAPTYGGIHSTAAGIFTNVTLAGNTGSNGADYSDFNVGSVTSATARSPVRRRRRSSTAAATSTAARAASVRYPCRRVRTATRR